jgi:predicted nucleic-acid-binding Zn-ribbon protein
MPTEDNKCPKCGLNTLIELDKDKIILIECSNCKYFEVYKPEVFKRNYEKN